MSISTAINNILNRLIDKTLKKSKQGQLSRYKMAKDSMQAPRTAWINIGSLFFMTAGIFSA